MNGGMFSVPAPIVESDSNVWRIFYSNVCMENFCIDTDKKIKPHVYTAVKKETKYNF